jgi:two-component system, cell cycle sensor histidine kinase and response regulator CckA
VNWTASRPPRPFGNASTCRSFSSRRTRTTPRSTEPSGPGAYLLKPSAERELRLTIDMTLNRHACRTALKESEQKYATTLTSIADAVISTDAEGRINFLNPVAEALTQWRRT